MLYYLNYDIIDWTTTSSFTSEPERARSFVFSINTPFKALSGYIRELVRAINKGEF